MRFLSAVTFVSILSLSGCASTPPRWNLNGKSQEELNSRHLSCDEFAARNVAPAMTYGGADPYSVMASLLSLSGQSYGMDKVYESCMNAGGFTKFSPNQSSNTQKDVVNNRNTEEAIQSDLVERAHPGWKQTVTSPQFAAWLQGQPNEIKKLGESPWAVDAIKMIDLYKADTNRSSRVGR